MVEDVQPSVAAGRGGQLRPGSHLPGEQAVGDHLLLRRGGGLHGVFAVGRHKRLAMFARARAHLLRPLVVSGRRHPHEQRRAFVRSGTHQHVHFPREAAFGQAAHLVREQVAIDEDGAPRRTDLGFRQCREHSFPVELPQRRDCLRPFALDAERRGDCQTKGVSRTAQLIRQCRIRRNALVAGERHVLGEAATGLADGLLEQPLRHRTRGQIAHAHAAGGFPEDGDVAGIAAERRDVVPNPLQGHDLILQPLVARRALGRLGGERRMRKEAEQPKPVVDGNQHHALARQRLAIVERRTAAAGNEGAAVDPHHHRRLGIHRAARRPDVQVQAVLADRNRPLRVEALLGLHLQTRIGIGRGSALALPRCRRRRRRPPQLAHRRRRKGDALERHHRVVLVGVSAAHIARARRNQLANKHLGRWRCGLRARWAGRPFFRRAAKQNSENEAASGTSHPHRKPRPLARHVHVFPSRLAHCCSASFCNGWNTVARQTGVGRIGAAHDDRLLGKFDAGNWRLKAVSAISRISCSVISHSSS